MYKRFDKSAKEKVRRYLEKVIIDDTERRGPDMYVNRRFRGHIEVETKTAWKTYDYPYEDVRIPARKGKYTKLPGKVHYFILSANQERAIIVPGQALKEEYLQEVPNRYCREGEYFYVIPRKHWRIVDLEE